MSEPSAGYDLTGHIPPRGTKLNGGLAMAVRARPNRAGGRAGVSATGPGSPDGFELADSRFLSFFLPLTLFFRGTDS